MFTVVMTIVIVISMERMIANFQSWKAHVNIALHQPGYCRVTDSLRLARRIITEQSPVVLVAVAIGILFLSRGIWWTVYQHVGSRYTMYPLLISAFGIGVLYGAHAMARAEKEPDHVETGWATPPDLPPYPGALSDLAVHRLFDQFYREPCLMYSCSRWSDHPYFVIREGFHIPVKEAFLQILIWLATEDSSGWLLQAGLHGSTSAGTGAASRSLERAVGKCLTPGTTVPSTYESKRICSS